MFELLLNFDKTNNLDVQDNDRIFLGIISWLIKLHSYFKGIMLFYHKKISYIIFVAIFLFLILFFLTTFSCEHINNILLKIKIWEDKKIPYFPG